VYAYVYVDVFICVCEYLFVCVYVCMYVLCIMYGYVYMYVYVLCLYLVVLGSNDRLNLEINIDRLIHDAFIPMIIRKQYGICCPEGCVDNKTFYTKI
jgi:hypothetical protein